MTLDKLSFDMKYINKISLSDKNYKLKNTLNNLEACLIEKEQKIKQF